MSLERPPAGGEPRALRALGRVVSALTAAAAALAAAGVLASLALIGWAVVMRYAFNRAPVWVDDLVGLMLVAVVMLAAAQVLRRGEHIAVDVLTDTLTGRAERWARALSVAAAALVAMMLIVNGWQTAMQSRQLGIVTEGRLEWPVWLLMLLLPAGGVLMALVCIESLWRLALGLPPAAPQRHGAGARTADE
ncbi:MAG: TRAP transporter small permease [Ideonella sp.]|nr:TRAP transporter small permease [Ideonella sp.]MCC7458875.1 TRAP transporter small permease [Nitrospira sp.]